MADIGDGERSDFNFIDIKRMIALENTLVIRAQIAYYIDSEDTLIGKVHLLRVVYFVNSFIISHYLKIILRFGNLE